MKGLQKLVLAGVAALGLSACDERKDFVVAEGTFTCSPAKLIYEQRIGKDTYRLECYSTNEGLMFRSPVNPARYGTGIYCFEKSNCSALYRPETMPK